MDDEPQILQRARTGDREALDQLLAHYQPQVFRFARQMCRQDQDAEGVVQDTLFAMARSVGDFKGESATSTWLYTIARNACIKRRRKGKYAPTGIDSLEAQPDLADADRSPEDEAAGRQLEGMLRNAIANLEPKYREVLVLRDVEQLTAPEVADVTGLKVAGVKSRLHRARAMIREALAGEIGTSEDPSCPDVVTMYSRYLEQELSAGTCADMEAHLADCERCTDTCGSLKHVLGVCQAVPTMEVPEHVQKAVREQISEFLQKT